MVVRGLLGVADDDCDDVTNGLVRDADRFVGCLTCGCTSGVTNTG